MGVSSVSLYLMVILWEYRTHPSGVPAKAGQTCSKDKSTLYAKDDRAGVDIDLGVSTYKCCQSESRVMDQDTCWASYGKSCDDGPEPGPDPKPTMEPGTL